MPGRRGTPERFLTTVAMTDIVGSTEHAAELGDSAWRELLQQHHALVRAELRHRGGREIDTAGDGFFVIFDAPANAVASVLAISEEVGKLGLAIRAGVHVGEVQQMAGKVTGIAVVIASRIMANAGAGEVLRLVDRARPRCRFWATFEDRGVRPLKGVPGDWRVFSVQRTEADAVAVPAVQPLPGTAGRGGAPRTIAADLATTAALHCRPCHRCRGSSGDERSPGVRLPCNHLRWPAWQRIRWAYRPLTRGAIALIAVGTDWRHRRRRGLLPGSNSGADTVSQIDLTIAIIGQHDPC